MPCPGMINLILEGLHTSLSKLFNEGNNHCIDFRGDKRLLGVRKNELAYMEINDMSHKKLNNLCKKKWMPGDDIGQTFVSGCPNLLKYSTRLCENDYAETEATRSFVRNFVTDMLDFFYLN